MDSAIIFQMDWSTLLPAGVVLELPDLREQKLELTDQPYSSHLNKVDGRS